jgi:hypothetical protein
LIIRHLPEERKEEKRREEKKRKQRERKEGRENESIQQKKATHANKKAVISQFSKAAGRFPIFFPHAAARIQISNMYNPKFIY